MRLLLSVTTVLLLATTATAQQKHAAPINVPGFRIEAEIDTPPNGTITGMTPQAWTAFHGWAFDCLTGQQPTSVTARHRQNGVDTDLPVYVVGGQHRPDVLAAFYSLCPALTTPLVGISVYFPTGVPMLIGYGVVEVTFHYADRTTKLTRTLNFIGR